MAASPEAEAPQTEPAAEPGLMDRLGELVASTREVTADILELFGLEARLAGLSVARLLAIGVAAAFTVIAAWLCLQGALVYWLHQLGLNLGLAFLLFAVVNLAATAGLAWLAIRFSRHMTFAATRRALKREAEPADEQP